MLVPFERLPGGHQVKNAERLQDKGAVVMVTDERMQQQPGILLEEMRHLMRSPKERAVLAEKLHAEAKPDAAKSLAKMILQIGEEGVPAKIEQVGEDEKPE